MNLELQGLFEKFLQHKYPQELQKIQGQTQQTYEQLGQPRPQTIADKAQPFLQAGMSIAGAFDERGKVAPMQQQMKQNYQNYDARQTANYQNPFLMKLQGLESQRAGLNDEYVRQKDLYGIGRDSATDARNATADSLDDELTRARIGLVGEQTNATKALGNQRNVKTDYIDKDYKLKVSKQEWKEYQDAIKRGQWEADFTQSVENDLRNYQLARDKFNQGISEFDQTFGLNTKKVENQQNQFNQKEDRLGTQFQQKEGRLAGKDKEVSLSDLTKMGEGYLGTKTQGLRSKMRGELMKRNPEAFVNLGLAEEGDANVLKSYFEHPDFDVDAPWFSTRPYTEGFDPSATSDTMSYYQNLPVTDAIEYYKRTGKWPTMGDKLPPQQLGGQQLGQPPAPQLGQPAGNVTEADIDNMTEEELIRFLNGQ